VLPWCDGLELLSRLRERNGDAAIIMFAESGTVEDCAAGMKAGLADFVLKSSATSGTLATAIRSAMDRREQLRDLVRREEANHRYREELLQHQRELKTLNESLEQQIEERTRVAERRAQQLRMLASEL